MVKSSFVIFMLQKTSVYRAKASNIFKHQDTLHASSGYVEVDIPVGVALVLVDFSMAQ